MSLLVLLTDVRRVTEYHDILKPTGADQAAVFLLFFVSGFKMPTSYYLHIVEREKCLLQILQ